jgi:hypothetical protein
MNEPYSHSKDADMPNAGRNDKPLKDERKAACDLNENRRPSQGNSEGEPKLT